MLTCMRPNSAAIAKTPDEWPGQPIDNPSVIVQAKAFTIKNPKNRCAWGGMRPPRTPVFRWFLILKLIQGV
jgi:hypothetical protein